MKSLFWLVVAIGLAGLAYGPLQKRYGKVNTEKAPQRESPEEQDKQWEAYLYPARDEIKKVLRAPASATFSDPLTEPQETGVRTLPGGRTIAFGWVETPNKFGTKVRLQWGVLFDQGRMVYLECGDQKEGRRPADLEKVPIAQDNGPQKPGSWMWKGSGGGSLNQPVKR